MKPLREQTELPAEYIDSLDLQETYTSMPVKQLALNRDDNGSWWTSYYVGITKINGQALEVLPKVENLDFMSLFSFALLYQPSSEYFSSYYDIDWDEEVIASSELYNMLTPLLVMRYLNILDKLVGKGLKRDYITIEENLHSKIRGKLKPIANWRTNELKKKEDYFYCQYQVFSADIPVNRLLKKALDISFSLLGDVRSRSNNLTGLAFLSSKLKLLDVFRGVKSDVRVESIRNCKFDKLNRYYTEAISLAKCIIRHQDNSLNDGSEKMKVPLFWIDMSRLFEVYVLGLLQKNYPNQILFQVKGSYDTQCDYLHTGEGIVIDAKYKKWYSSELGRLDPDQKKSLIADIREISAYARDERLLSYMNNDVKSPICIIVYPDEGATRFEPLLSDSVKSNKIEGYHDFYRLGIDLPRL